MEGINVQKATFAAGCFWGVELKFSQVPGVISTRVGYIGGHTINPTYEQVCHGDTGHAEAIEIEFDPDDISYLDLLDVFWDIHNPTTLNRQGPDVGTQYRSAAFYHNEEQKNQILESKQKLEQAGIYNLPITTEIAAAGVFYPAEEYHQKYLEKNGVNHC
jgi:peptide-methionine (S)-S-oxide reductase